MALDSREDVQQRPSSRKSKRRWFIWILKYILPPRLSNLRRRRTEQARPVNHSTVAFPARTRSTQTPAWDQWSTHGFEGQVSGPSTIESHSIYSFRVPFLPEDSHPLHDGLEAENLATGLTPLSSSPSPPAIAIPDSGDTTAIETEQTSPLVLDNNTGDISGVSSSPTDTVPVSVHSLRNKNPFQETAYIIRPNGKKRGVLMMIDTQSCCNLLDVEKWKPLNLKMEPYDRTLYPLQTFSAPIRGVKPCGIAKNVEWHIAGHMKTNISDFLVVDMRHYDAVLGSSDIIRYDILRPGPGIERPAVDRNLVQA